MFEDSSNEADFSFQGKVNHVISMEGLVGKFTEGLKGSSIFGSVSLSLKEFLLWIQKEFTIINLETQVYQAYSYSVV